MGYQCILYGDECVHRFECVEQGVEEKEEDEESIDHVSD